jgi:hypothetical protein
MKFNRFIYAILVCLFFVQSSLAQNENISASSLGFKARVGGALGVLDETKTYRVVLPDEGVIAKGQTRKFNLFSTGFDLDAKRSKGEEKVDKVFRIVSSGMTPILRERDEPLTALAGSGFVKQLYFNFPLSVEVSNAEGQVERIFEVVSSSQEMTEMFHAGTLGASASFDKTPFPTKEQMNKQYSENRDAALSKVEREFIEKTLYPKVRSIIQAAYGSAKYAGGFLFVYAPSKSATAAPADLSSKCAELKNTLTELNDKAKESTALSTLDAQFSYFHNALVGGNVPSTLMQLYLGNAALAGVVSGHITESEDYFSRFYMEFTENNKSKAIDFSGYYELLFNTYGYFHLIKQNNGTSVSIPFRPKGFEAKLMAQNAKAEAQRAQAEAEEKARMLPVYNGAPGTIVYLDGKEEKFFSGNIFYDFNNTTTESKGITALVPLKIQINGEMQQISPINVLYFVLKEEEKTYARTSIKGSNALKIAAMATGNFDIVEFWEIMHIIRDQDSDRAIFLKKVGKDEFSVTKSYYLEAVDLYDVIRKRKPAKELLDNCPALTAAIDKKEITEVKSIDDLKKFILLYEGNCK